MLALLLLTTSVKSELVEFSLSQWRKDPEMRIEDAYKWLLHATRGGEHAIESEEGPRRWMEREWKTLGRPGKGEREVIPLRPDGKIIRVNLRPYRARGGDKEMLLAIFVASAQRFRSDKAEFVREWHALGSALCKKQVGHLTLPEWSRIDRQMKPLGYPAIHHSERYERARKPAYRVVLSELWL